MTEFHTRPEDNTEESKEVIHFLKNPLPEPPRRAHVRMTFDFADETEEDDFDVEVSDNDDFDI